MSQSIESNNGTAPTTQHISLSDNIPNQLKSNMHYFNLNNQLKYDLEQQQVIKLQQMEAIKLIQVSLEKLTATTTVPLHNQTTRKQNGSTPAPSILVYKETSLHKNLLVSKILNKAKFFYYQSIVQTMRLSLMSKLNYYSTLIQQLYPSQTVTSNDTTSKEDKPMSPVENESSLIEEMKLLMQQILYDTYQFNSLNSCNVNSSSIDTNPNALIEFTSFNSTNLTTVIWIIFC
jgi:urease beta subunit